MGTADARAAVAIVLREPGPGEDADVLFIRRAERPHDPWSGHIAFPGGRKDSTDASLLATVERETFEEVGLRLELTATFLARLADIPVRSQGRSAGLIVSPFVYVLSAHASHPPLALDAREVAEALWIPIAPLARGEGKGLHAFEMSGDRYELPSLAIGPHTLWGLTHRMFHALVELVEAV